MALSSHQATVLCKAAACSSGYSQHHYMLFMLEYKDYYFQMNISFDSWSTNWPREGQGLDCFLDNLDMLRSKEGLADHPGQKNKSLSLYFFFLQLKNMHKAVMGVNFLYKDVRTLCKLIPVWIIKQANCVFLKHYNTFIICGHSLP